MRRQVIGLCLALGVTGCIVPEAGVRPASYDFGPPPVSATRAGSTAVPVLTISDVRAPRHLESTYIYYRFAFADAQALKPYADSRWAMPPSQLVAQRIRSRLSQEAHVLNFGDARTDLALRVELEQFDQVFDTQNASRGVVRLRASLTKERRLIAQQTFSAEHPATSADAAGGVHALTKATDAALDALAAWVATRGK